MKKQLNLKAPSFVPKQAKKMPENNEHSIITGI